MPLPETVRRTVLDLEQKIEEALQAATAAEENRGDKQQAAASLYENMGWRERYLGGWLGGDRDTVRKYRDLNTLAAQFNDAAGQKREEVKDLDQDVIEKIHEYLQQTDATFRALLVPQQAAQELQDAVAGFLETIDNALSEIDDAQSMETMDMFSKNKGISFMSSIANSEAKSAVRAVESAAPAFQQAVERYGDTVKQADLGNIKAEFGDTMDLVFDLAFDGFDFMSMFTLSALGNAEDNLKAARSKVDEVGDLAARHLATADEAVSAYIARARSACRPA